MEKYGYQQLKQEGKIKKAGEQTICQRCGGKLNKHASQLICENCGSLPFEDNDQKQDSER